MNALYLILIAIGFSAGVLATVLKADTSTQLNNTCIENNDNSTNEIYVLDEPKTDKGSLLLLLE